MAKVHSWKFWLGFWLIAVLLLAGWFVFLQVKNKNFENLGVFAKILPIGAEKRAEILALADIYAASRGEKSFLVLFQNDMELRPGGGFIGAFGVVRVKNGKIEDIQVFDTGNFDKNIPAEYTPAVPYPDEIGLSRFAGKMRDSNWSPDFQTNAARAEYFYKLGSSFAPADAKAMAGEKSAKDKGENIDGVIAINTRVLDSILEITGPVKIDGYPGEYRDETAILQLEYQVEKGYLEQGIEKSERKNIMGELAGILAGKAHNFTLAEQFRLVKKLSAHLKQKDIQFHFADEKLQSQVEKVNWGGRVRDFDGDYLMAVDANLLALKTDFCIKRKMNYTVDLSSETPQAVLNITYEHTCRAKDWMTSDYRDWLRVYVPAGSNLLETSGQTGEVQRSEEFGKSVFGMRVDVPVSETKTISLKYSLSEYVREGDYHLLVQKQSGSGDVPIEITLKKPDEKEAKKKETLKGDREFEF